MGFVIIMQLFISSVKSEKYSKNGKIWNFIEGVNSFLNIEIEEIN